MQFCDGPRSFSTVSHPPRFAPDRVFLGHLEDLHVTIWGGDLDPSFGDGINEKDIINPTVKLAYKMLLT
jgi:hypothetical protein